MLGPLADLRPSGPTSGLGTGQQKEQDPVAELALGPGFGIASVQSYCPSPNPSASSLNINKRHGGFAY